MGMMGVNKGDGYSISHDMATIDIGEATKIVTDMAKAASANAVSFQEALTDPMAQSGAMQANRTRMKEPAVKSKPVKETTKNEPVYRKAEPRGLEKEFNRQAQDFVEQYRTMKKDSLLGLRKDVGDLGKQPTSEQIIALVTSSYTKGHEAEAHHAFDFLLETTTGELNTAIKQAKAEYEEKNRAGIEKGLNIENIAKGVEGGVADYKGKAGKIQNLNEKFIDLVAMEADTNLLDEQLLSKVSHEEASKILEFFTSAAGDKMRKTEVGPEMHALWQSLQAIQGYRGVYNQINRAHPSRHYEHALAKHSEHFSSAA